MDTYRAEHPRAMVTEFLESLTSAGLAVDDDGDVVASNRLARSLFEVDEGDLHGKPLESLCRIYGHPDDFESTASCTSRRGSRFQARLTTLQTPTADERLCVYILRDVHGPLDRRFEESLLGIARSPEFVSDDFEIAADLLTRVAGQTMRTQRTSLWLLDQSRRRLECLSLFDRNDDRHERGAQLSARDYPAYFRALEEGRAIAAVDVLNDERTRELSEYLQSFRIASMLDAVIRVSGEVVGVVCHEEVGRRREWLDQEITFAAEIAGQAAQAILSTRSRKAQRERDDLAAELRRTQRLDAIGRLAGGVAHDFNNILTVILGYTDLGLELPDQSEHCFERIRDGAQRAADLTSQLLSVGRKQVLRPRHVDLNELVPKGVDLLRRLIPENVVLEFQSTAPRAVVHADPNQIEQVLINLCINARDAVAEHGGCVTVRVGVEAEEDREKWAVLTVVDNGTGMSSEVLDSAFEPFFTTKAQGDGSGLGLSMVYGIATQHGGDVRAHSEPGNGSIFDVLLPLVVDGQVDLPRPGPPPALSLTAPTRSGHILLAEDAEPILDLASSALEKAGYRVTIARNGQEAVDRFGEDSEAFDLAVFDIIMPRLTGPKAYERIREKAPDLPVVFTTGYGADSLAEHLLAREDVALVLKPYGTAELLEAVRKTLEAVDRAHQ